MRRWLVVIVTFLAGVYFFVEFFLPKHIIVGGTDFMWSAYDKRVLDVVRVMFVPALLLGIINILRVHGFMLLRVSFFHCLEIMLLTGVFFAINGNFGHVEIA